MPSEETGESETLLEIKARLLESGEIFIPKDLDMPCFPSRSTAGPDAGMQCFTFDLGGSRVKLEATDDNDAKYRLAESDGGFTIFEGEEALTDAWILPTLAHSPNQAFINLSDRCIHKCSFCVLPQTTKHIIKDMSPERVLRIIRIAARHPGFEAIALTSGIDGSESKTNKLMAEVVKAVRETYPDLPIGVETYFEDLEDIGRLKAAGAEEIKVNVESWPEYLFEKVCPTRDREIILKGLQKAVEVFGKGKVASNIIIGMGETDEEVEEGVSTLAEMGVIANIRGLRVNAINESSLVQALGKVPERVTAERLVRLAKMHKGILEANGLSTLDFKTMCHSCQCCDIVPMRDL